MARAPDLNRITKEDFPQEEQPLIEKIAYPINSFMEQTRNALSNNLNFDNLNQEIVEINAIVDANGAPLTQLQYKSNLNTRVIGMLCINAVNNTTPGTPPTGMPFATFVQSTNIVTISNIKGLVANTQYTLRFIIIGS